MSKKPRSFTIDEDIKRELSEREELNASAVVNNYLREYLAATEGSQNQAIIREINRQIAELDEEIDERKEKRESLKRRRERIKQRQEEQNEERLEEELERFESIPADPEHPAMEQIGAKVGMSAENVAEAHADYHGKELQTDGKRGFQ